MQVFTQVPDGGFQLLVIPGRIFRREHQHQIPRVGILALDAAPAQLLRQGGSRHVQDGSVQRQFQRLPKGTVLAAVQREISHRTGLLCKLVQFPAQTLQTAHALHQPDGIPFGQVPVASVERLQNQVGRAGGTKQCQRVPNGGLFFYRGTFAQMEVRAASQDGQGLVAGIAAHGRTQSDGVSAPGRQKAQVRAVGVVHQQRHALRLADGRQGRDVLHAAEVIWAGEIDAEGLLSFPAQRVEGGFQVVRAHRAAAQRTGILRRRPEPPDIEILQRRRIEQGFVGVPCRQQHRPLSGLGCRLQCQKEHRTDALRRAFGAVIGVRRAEQFRCVGLALGDDAFRLVQLVRTFYLGDVVGLKPEELLSFVAGHVEPGGSGLGIPDDKIHNGCVHYSQASPSAQALQVPPISIGTSMPCFASS